MAVYTLRIDPTPRFPLSPYLYMQFMEPLGATDSSVEAAWDLAHGDWRADMLTATRALAPTMLRWGGCLASYYRWREGVGPISQRAPYHNLLWGGIESHRVGTHEFLTLCREVGAAPLYCVNLEGDGRSHWRVDPDGRLRAGSPEEAAAWVAYCNDPDDALRRSHGVGAPYNVRYWQLGNETSYGRDGWDADTAAKRTLAFARAMRAVDAGIALIGWGDRQHDGAFWSRTMLDLAGQELDMLAFHHMFDLPADGWAWPRWRRDLGRAYELLMGASALHDARIQQMRASLGGADIPLALTECHLALPGRNRNDVLSTWAAGVANARLLNVHERHGDALAIATAADFCGNRWLVNALMLPTPPYAGRAYLMPVGSVMALYRHHVGSQAVAVEAAGGLDVTASRTGNRLFVHLVNPSANTAVEIDVQAAEHSVSDLTAWQIAAPPFDEVDEYQPDQFAPVERAWPAGEPLRVPPCAVLAIEGRLRDGMAT